MAKVLKTLRTHWKKSLFAASVLSYGTYYLLERKYNAELLQAYCYEALKYSRERVNPEKTIKRVTIFLNPIANRERGKYLFDKNVAPILNLSGLDVRLIRLEKNSEANEYMKEIDLNDTDMVVVAGGNATLNEVISGLINRPDSEEFLSRMPIGIIPIGETNTFAHKWFDRRGAKKTKESEFRLLADSAMAIIKGDTAQADLIKVTLHHSPDQTTEERYDDESGTDAKKRGAYTLLKENQIYALSNVSCGFVTAIDANEDSYWYYGWLRSHMNKYFTKRYLQRAPLKYKFDYKLKCFGCSNCLNREEILRELEAIQNEQNGPSKKNKSSIISIFKSISGIKDKENTAERQKNEKKLKSLEELVHKSQIHNLNCDRELSTNFTQVQIISNVNDWDFTDQINIDGDASQHKLSVGELINQEPSYLDTVIVKDPEFNAKEMHLADKKLLRELRIRKYNDHTGEKWSKSFNSNRFAIEIDGEVYKLNNKTENDLILSIKHVEKRLNLIKMDPYKNEKIEVNYWPNIYLISKQTFDRVLKGKNKSEQPKEELEMPSILPFEKFYLKYWMPRTN